MSDPKIFSLSEAERALPLVRRIVADIQAAYAELRTARDDLRLASAQPSESEGGALKGLRTAVDQDAERVRELIRELEAVGGHLKDFEKGLVDFYALLDDRLVYLCWRLGEDRITHWHEVNAGFGGRQPIDEALFPGTVS